MKLISSFCVCLLFFFAPLRLCAQNAPVQARDRDLPIEIFQVLELPLTVHEALLVKSDVKSEKSYVVKLAVGNSSDVQLIGLRYSLIKIDSENRPQPIANRTEGFSVPPYTSKSVTFKTPIKFKPKDGERLVLMVEQVISRESIWEVVKAKEALDTYAKGDYSVRPTVLRVANAVDAPPEVQRFIPRR